MVSSPNTLSFDKSILGYRTWQIDPKTFELASATDFDSRWTAGVNTAECRTPSRKVLHSDNCHCGFNAFYEFSDSLEQYQSHFGITGAIAGAGRCAVHETGFRSEQAQIIALLSPVDNVFFREVAKKYDVPLFTDEKEFQRFAEKYAAPQRYIRNKAGTDERQALSETSKIHWRKYLTRERTLSVLVSSMIMAVLLLGISILSQRYIFNWTDDVGSYIFFGFFLAMAFMIVSIFSSFFASLFFEDWYVWGDWEIAQTITTIIGLIGFFICMILSISSFEKSVTPVRQAYSEMTAKVASIESFYKNNGFYPKQIPDVYLNGQAVDTTGSSYEPTKSSYTLDTSLPDGNEIQVEGNRGLLVTASCLASKSPGCSDDIYDFAQSLPFISSIEPKGPNPVETNPQAAATVTQSPQSLTFTNGIEPQGADPVKTNLETETSSTAPSNTTQGKSCFLNSEETFSNSSGDTPEAWIPKFNCE